MTRGRADVILVARGFFESRARAQAAIAAGTVSVAGQILRKASDMIAADAPVEARAAHPYVSRGGLKLAHALDSFAIDPAGLACLDVGASTGGFSDVLLRRGAARVTAVDTGRDQLHPTLRAHPRLRPFEATDIRVADPLTLGAPFDLITVDVSFISLALVVPALAPLAARPATLVALVKPQFEVGRKALSRKGIVSDPAARDMAVAQVTAAVAAARWSVRTVIPSPVTGGDGNIEFLLHAERC